MKGKIGLAQLRCSLFLVRYWIFPLVFTCPVISIYSIAQNGRNLNDIRHYLFYPSEIVHTGDQQHQGDGGTVQEKSYVGEWCAKQ